MSDTEIHLAHLRFSLLKDKQYRILKKLLKNQKYYINDANKLKFKNRYQTIIKDTIWELKIYDKVSE
jgi:hypothetical protein